MMKDGTKVWKWQAGRKVSEREKDMGEKGK